MNTEVLFDFLIQSHGLVAIYYNQKKPTSFLVGRMLSFSQNHLLLSLISPEGYEAETCLVDIQSIYRLDEQLQYFNEIPTLKNTNTLCVFENDLWASFLCRIVAERKKVQFVDGKGRTLIFGYPIEVCDSFVLVSKKLPGDEQAKYHKIGRKRVALAVCEEASTLHAE